VEEPVATLSNFDCPRRALGDSSAGFEQG
jgi:hypothetical protein